MSIKNKLGHNTILTEENKNYYFYILKSIFKNFHKCIVNFLYGN